MQQSRPYKHSLRAWRSLLPGPAPQPAVPRGLEQSRTSCNKSVSLEWPYRHNKLGTQTVRADRCGYKNQRCRHVGIIHGCPPYLKHAAFVYQNNLKYTNISQRGSFNCAHRRPYLPQTWPRRAVSFSRQLPGGSMAPKRPGHALAERGLVSKIM